MNRWVGIYLVTISYVNVTIVVTRITEEEYFYENKKSPFIRTLNGFSINDITLWSVSDKTEWITGNDD
jgi:hypothetical protein